MQIQVLLDATGSMTVLGKEAIAESMIQTLSLLSKLDADFRDDSFSFKRDWLPSAEEIKKIKKAAESFIVLSDGFDVDYPEAANVAVVLLGSDSGVNFRRNRKNTFRACDILNAALYLKDSAKRNLPTRREIMKEIVEGKTAATSAEGENERV